MKNLNICIDIDGTITDPYFWLERAATHFGVKVNYDEFVQYEFHKVLKITEEAYNKFYEEETCCRCPWGECPVKR